MLQAGDLIYTTNNLKLACALFTLGHKFRDGESSIIESDNNKQIYFVFDDTGSLVSSDARKWAGGLEAMEAEEPLAYLWAYAHNRDRLLDEIKQAIPMVRIVSGDKVLLYPKNATAEQKRKIMQKL